jgi:polysaccharide biosynthesis/export protein
VGRFTKGFLAALGMTLAVTTAARAQSAEQIQKFQSLSAEQREAAIKAAEQATSVTRTDAEPLSEPIVVTPAPAESTGPSAIEQRYSGRTDAASLSQSPSERSVKQQLKQFGYDLFAGAPTTFAPATDVPVPADYVIGPGDVIEVQLFGKDNQQYSLVVDREGRISFPELGAISASGLRFTELRADLEKRVAEQMIGVKAAVSMGALRSVRVFVLGDVNRPGSYTVSSLSTMTNALFVSGGIRPIPTRCSSAAASGRSARCATCSSSATAAWSRAWTFTTCCCAAIPATMRACSPAT